MNSELGKKINDQLRLIQKITQCTHTLFIYNNNTIITTEEESDFLNQNFILDLTSLYKNSQHTNDNIVVSLNHNDFINQETLSLYKKIDIYSVIYDDFTYGRIVILFNTEQADSYTEYVKIICNTIGSLFKKQNLTNLFTNNSQASELLLSSIHGVPWSYNFETNNFLYVGPQSEEILGCSPEKINTIEDWLNIVHPDDREKSLNFCLNESLAGNDHVFNYRIIKKDGSIAWIRDIVKVIQKNHITTDLHGFMIDITDVKVKEQELVNVNNQLKYILDYTNITLNIVDEKQNIIFHSNKDTASIKQKCYEYFCNEKEQCIDCPALNDINKSVTFYRNLNNSAFQVTAFPIITNEGKTHIGEVRVDLTERMKKERQINDLKEKIEFLLTAGKISFIEYNFKTDIFDCNQVFNNITGYNFNNTQLDLNWLISRIHPNNISLFKSELNKVFKKHKNNLELEFRFLTAENNYIWFHFQGQIDSKEPSKLVGLLIDITNNKRLLNELIDAKNKSINANELKSKFLANMSHEIRTPMNAILGFTNLLKNRIKEAPLSNYITSIESSGKTLLELINDLLDLEKINSGKVDIKKEKANIGFVLDDVYQTFILFSQNKGLTLDIVRQSNIPQDMYIDVLKIKQILINLINNAIKFTETGGIKVEYSFIPQKEKDYGTLNINIIDSGIGIPIEKQKVIFEPFIQENLHNTKQHEGTGLGLSIVQKIIQLMNGTIVLESAPGKGSKFSISIPEIVYSSSKEIVNHFPAESITEPASNQDICLNQKLDEMSFSEDDKKILLQKFDDNIIPIWKQLSEMLSLTNLNVFVKEIDEVLNKAAWPQLESYNKSLKTNVKSFDFEQLPLQIKDFKKYIDYLYTVH